MSTEQETAGKKRTISGLWVFVILLFFIFAFNFRPPVPTIHCTDEIIESKPRAIMLGAWWCSYCYKARQYFDDNSISYCEYDVEHSEKGQALYEKLGGRGVPVIIIGKDVFFGYDEQGMDQALNQEN